MAHVLVADDSPTVRHLLSAILRNASHIVDEAENGEEALTILYASSRPMIVLLDVVMPKLGGIGVLYQMESSPKLRDRDVFILMTATPDAIPPKAIAELLQRFSIPLVVKPIDPSHLLLLVDHAAGRLKNDSFSETNHEWGSRESTG
jgi:two-component system, chemotaxis family, chemotaxis protein CheY